MRLPEFPTRFAAMLVAAVLAAAVPAAARDRDDHRRDEHHRDEIRRAVDAGEIKSLADILAVVRGKLPGDIAGVEIERKDGRWVYEFRVIDGKGRLFDAYIDARSGEIERVKEK